MSTERQRKSTGRREGRIENLRPWKPGESGNPAGRPKGVRYLTEQLRARVAADPAILDAVAEKLFALALDGDLGAIREIADRLDGKPKAAVQVEGDGMKAAADPEQLAAAMETLRRIEAEEVGK